MIPLAVICGRGPGPDETFVRRDLAALERLGWAVRVFGLNGNGAGRRASPVALRETLSKSLRMAFSPRQAFALARRAAIVSAAADWAGKGGIVLAEFAWLTADVASAASAVARRPWACFVHAWDVFTRPPRETRARLRGAGAVLACSRKAADAVLGAGVPSSVVHLVRHGMPWGELDRIRAGKKSLSVCAVGRFERKKGFDLLLRAWPSVERALPGASLRLIGEGRERRSLERLAARCGDGVRILPAMDEKSVWREIRASEILVLPSRRTRNGDSDGVANVLPEAMALGAAVITTDAGAAGEIVRDDETGVLLPSAENTPGRLAQEIVGLLRDDARRLSMTAEAGRLVRKEFDPDRTSCRLNGILNALRRA